MKADQDKVSRRALFGGAGATLAAGALLPALPSPASAAAEGDRASGENGAKPPCQFRLGLVTEGVAGEWTLEEMLLQFERFGFHAAGIVPGRRHGISLALDPDARRQVYERTTNKTNVALFSVETPCTLDPADAGTQRATLDLAAEYARLAFEINAAGILIRPGAGISVGETASPEDLDQAAALLKAMAETAAGYSLEVWVEMSGDAPGLPADLRGILDRCGHPSAGIAWSCRIADGSGGTLAAAFGEVREHLRCVHLGELWTLYPYADLFRLLRESGYDRYTLARLRPTSDPEGVLRYYRRLWEVLAG